MDVSAVGAGLKSGSAASSSHAGQAGGATTLDYNSFLQLLIAQMQNQDPLEPMKSSDYVAQLATFSEVEKTIEMNSRMADLLAAVQLQQAGALIGQTVTSADGTVSGRIAAARVVDGTVIATLSDGRELVCDNSVVLGGGSM